MSRVTFAALALFVLGVLASPALADENSPGVSFEKACGRIKVDDQRLRVDVESGQLRKCKVARLALRKWVRKWNRLGRQDDGLPGSRGQVRVKGVRYRCFRSRLDGTTGRGWHHLCHRGTTSLGARYLF